MPHSMESSLRAAIQSGRKPPRIASRRSQGQSNVIGL